MKEIAEILEYANEAIARNQKYLCLRTLVKFLAENPAFRKQLYENCYD